MDSTLQNDETAAWCALLRAPDVGCQTLNPLLLDGSSARQLLEHPPAGIPDTLRRYLRSPDLEGVEAGVTPQQDVTLVIHRADGSAERVALKLRIDTPIEVEYYNKGGILPFVLGQLLA